MDQILKESGLFWLNNINIPDGEIHPVVTVPGILSISKHGKILLELNGMISSENAKEILIGNGDCGEIQIQGLLRGSAGYVLLEGIYRERGTHSFTGISHETLDARHCLVAPNKFPMDSVKNLVKRIIVHLDGFDDWIGKRSINTTANNRTIRAKYTKPAGLYFKQKNWELRVKHNLEGPWYKKMDHRSIFLKEVTTLEFKYRDKLDLTSCWHHQRTLEGFLTMLTNQKVTLGWPSLYLQATGYGNECKYYYARKEEATSNIKRHLVPASFGAIEDVFGTLLDNWMAKHKLIGPGIYLYLAVLRTPGSYIENIYANLLWGLESLHRKSAGENEHSAELREKIQRLTSIVNSHEGLNRSDRKFVSASLERTLEPSLSDRLIDIFSKLPLQFREGQLDELCKSCAKRRNDLSHFGGARDDTSYQSFIEDLAKKIGAIKYLFHASVLMEIGWSSKMIQDWLQLGMDRHQVKITFSEVGLDFDESLQKI